MLTDAGAVTLAVPRDRNGSFEPRLIPRHARRLAGFNERILSLHARGMSVRDILSDAFASPTDTARPPLMLSHQMRTPPASAGEPAAGRDDHG